MPRYLFGGFRLDTRDLVLLKDDSLVPLTPKALETLLVLIKGTGETVSKERLFEEVWPDQAVSEAVLSQNVYTLRTALREAGGEDGLIATVPRRGYRFTGSVKIEQTNFGKLEESLSVAILPFQALPPTEENLALGLVIADLLVAHLGGLGISAVHPTSGRPASLKGLARRSKVDGLVTGWVQRSGEQLRVSCQWLEPETGAPRWAEKFEGSLPEIFALQDRLCDAVAEQLAPKIEPRPPSGLSSTNPQTYRSFIRGRYLWSQRTSSALREAVTHFQEATESDPTYAPGWAGLADALVLLPFYSGDAPQSAFTQAEAAAQRALQLDGGLSQAHTSLAYSKFLFRWNWRQAEEGFRTALELNPSDANAHHWYGFMLAALGRDQEAISHAQQAVDRDPLALAINADLGFVLYFAHRSEDALRQFALTLELDEGFSYARFGMSLALERCGRLQEAVEQAEEAARLVPESPTMRSAVGRLMAMTGRTEEAREQLRRLKDQGASSIHRALVLIALGEIKEALRSLQQACVERSSYVVFLNQWPIYDPLRENEEFSRLVASVGLPSRPTAHPKRKDTALT